MIDESLAWAGLLIGVAAVLGTLAALFDKRARKALIISCALSTTAAIVFAGCGLLVGSSRPPPQPPLTSITVSPPSTTSPPIACKPTTLTSDGKLDVYQYYDPRGFLGDIGDIEKKEDVVDRSIRFVYVAAGIGPHEWDLKNIDGMPNPSPARFAGVMFLDGNWGRDAGAGYDLRGKWNVTWEARAVTEPVSVEFFAGGVSWVWDEKREERVPAPYPESMPRVTLAEERLNTTWKAFSQPLNLPVGNLACVIGPFGWLIKWDTNGVSTGRTRTLVIEIRKVFYQLRRD